MNWELKEISSLCEFAIDCVNKTAPIVDYETQYKMIRTTNVKGGFIDYETVRYVEEETFKKWTRRSKPKYGDVIFTREAPVGDVGRFTSTDEYFFLGQRLFHYRPDPEQLDWQYLAYVLQSEAVQGFVNGIAFGATVPHIKVEDAENLKIPVPPIEIQQKIGRILSAYDDLIENNLKRIKLLEEMAQITYKEWFVRMKFPGHENTPVDAETGLPEGWHEKPLETLASFLNGFAFKPEQLGDSGLPVIKIKELKGGVVGSTPRNSGLEVPEKYVVNTGDILFSWSGSLEVVLWQYEKGLLNQHLFKVKPNRDIPFSFVYLSLASCLPFFENLTTGATMKHIKRKELSFVKTLVPDSKLLNRFDKQVLPMLMSVLNLSQQNQKLKEARDILLPRLMIGMINVDNIDLPTLESN